MKRKKEKIQIFPFIFLIIRTIIIKFKMILYVMLDMKLATSEVNLCLWGFSKGLIFEAHLFLYPGFNDNSTYTFID